MIMTNEETFGLDSEMPKNCKDVITMRKDFNDFTYTLMKYFENFRIKYNLDISYGEMFNEEDFDSKLFIFVGLNTPEQTKKNFEENIRRDPFDQIWHIPDVRIDFRFAEEKEDSNVNISWRNTEDIFYRKFSEYHNHSAMMSFIIDYIEENYIKM